VIFGHRSDPLSPVGKDHDGREKEISVRGMLTFPCLKR